MAGIGSIVIQFKAEADKARRDIAQLNKSLESTGSVAERSRKRMLGLAKIGFAGLAAGATGAGVALFNMAQAAAQDAQSATRLAANIKNATKATDAQVASVEDWITKTTLLLGVTDEKLRPALARAVQSTKDIGEAQRLVELAMDISAGTGRDLGVVMQALARANDGNLNALKRLGITLGENTERAQQAGVIQRQLTKAMDESQVKLAQYGASSKEYARSVERVKGLQAQLNGLTEEGVDWQAELGRAYEDAALQQTTTAQGALDKLKVIWDEMQEAVGSSLIDPLTEFSEFLATPQGQVWLDDLMQDAAEAGQAISGLVDWLVTLDDKVKAFEESKLGRIIQGIENMQNGRAPWNDGPYRGEPVVTREQVQRGALGRARAESRSDYRAQVPQVNVTINNPKAEPSSLSIAAAIRTAKAAGWN